MGFFVGWKYFDSKDYYSFEAQQERQRLQQEKAERERKKAAQKAKIKAQRKKEQKRKDQEEWNRQSQDYFEEQFGLRKDEFQFEYINSDGDEYKDVSQNRFAKDFGQSNNNQSVALDRGMGNNWATRFNGKNKSKDLGPMGKLNNKQKLNSGAQNASNDNISNKSISRQKNSARIGSGGASGPGNSKLNRPF